MNYQQEIAGGGTFFIGAPCRSIEQGCHCYTCAVHTNRTDSYGDIVANNGADFFLPRDAMRKCGTRL